MTIRLATTLDIPSIAALKQISDKERYLHRIKESQAGKAAYLLVEQAGQIVGQVFLKYDGTPEHPEYPNMEDLLVAERFRGQGIGTLLIDECENRVRSKGFKTIGLSVNPTLNAQAMSLYEKLGYTSLGNKPYLDGVYNGVEDWVIDLVKTL